MGQISVNLSVQDDQLYTSLYGINNHKKHICQLWSSVTKNYIIKTGTTSFCGREDGDADDHEGVSGWGRDRPQAGDEPVTMMNDS